MGSNKYLGDHRVRTVLKPTQAIIESTTDLLDSKVLKCGQLDRNMRPNATSNTRCLAASLVTSSEEPSAFNKKQTALLHVKSHLPSNVLSNQTVPMAPNDPQTMTSPNSSLISPETAKIKLKGNIYSKIQAALSPHKKSPFTWVKLQGAETSQPKSDVQQSSTSSVSAATASPVNSKQTQTSIKKLHRKLSFSPTTPKTSKYSWVSSSCSPTAAARSALAKPQLKLFSSKALKVPGKTVKLGLEGKKLTTSAVLTKRNKVSGGAFTSTASKGSLYRWKAVAPSSAVSEHAASPRSSRRSSLYRWTAQKDTKYSASRIQHSPSTPLSSSGFKLRSRTKIIRRCSNR